ncbi:MAG: hypothetical protein M3179_13910 [Actinomycetota bacterium]|nr:hypothetical protein [Actinomycetota bacterium]
MGDGGWGRTCWWAAAVLVSMVGAVTLAGIAPASAVLDPVVQVAFPPIRLSATPE